MVRSLDLWAIMLLDGSLSMEEADDKVVISFLRNISLNLTVLPNEYLHTL